MASITLYPTKDAYFKQSSNYGSSTGLAIGNPGPSVADKYQTALDFAINSTFPAGTIINSAYLRLYRSSGVGAITVRVRGINSLWSETGITLNNMPSLGSSTYTGSVNTGSTYLSVNVTGRVQWHVDNPTKYGFYLDTTSDKGNYFFFYSRESSGSKPRLIVDYTLPNTNDPPNWGSTTSMAAPSTSRVSSTTSSISVSWASGTDPDGDTKTYKLECSVNGGTYTQIYSGTTAAYTHSIGSGNPGYTYQYRVRIYDGAEYSGYIYSGTVTKNTPPVFSGTISTSPSGNFSSGTTSISVTRPDATDVNGGTLYYTIWVSVNGGGYTELSTNASNPYNYTGANHAQGTTYRFRMQARDDLSETSGYLYSATITKNTLPTAPTSVSVSPSGIISTETKSLTVSWSGASSDTSSYRVYKYKNDSLVGTEYPTGTSLTDNIGTGNAGATYYYRVYSKDALEYSSGYKQSATVTKNTLPSPPTSVTLNRSGTIAENISTVDVSWSGANANDSGQSLKYDVYRYEDGSSTRIASLTSSTSLTDTIGIGNQGSSYYYRVYSHDGLEPSSSYKQSATFTKNKLTGPVLNSVSAIGFLSSNATRTISWTAASNTNGNTTFTYKLSSSNLTIYNSSVAVTSGYAMPIYVSGTVPTTPYIKFSDLKTKYASSSYNGTFTLTVTVTNAYGSTASSSKTVSVDLRTNPTGLTAPTLASTSYYTINGTNYYIPDRKTITINWGAATDPLGTAITYDVAISLDGGSSYPTTFRTGLSTTSTTYATAVTSRKTIKFRVIAKSGYGYTQTTYSATSVYFDYWNPPVVSLSNIERLANGFIFTAVVTQGSTSASALNTDYPTTTRYYKLGTAAAVYSTTTYTTSEIPLSGEVSSSFTVGYRNWGYYGIVSTTGYVTNTVTIPTYKPMFSIRETGVSVNSIATADGYKFRVAGNVLISPDINGDADLTVNGNISEGGTLLSNKYAPFSHSHDYLPLTGGTLSGGLTLPGGGNVPVKASIYNPASGVLVDIGPDHTTNMIVVRVIGNGYSGQHPIESIFQAYHYTPYGTLTQCKQINISGNLPAGKFMIHGSRVKLWFPTSGSYQTFIVYAYGMGGVIYSPSATSSGEPASSYKSTCSLRTILDSGNWSSYAAPASHSHSNYLTTTGKAADSDKLDGYHLGGTSALGSTQPYIPLVKADGVMEVGRYLDFHAISDDTQDHTARLSADPSTPGELYIQSNKIWHGGNLTPSNYLPLGGGTMTGALYPQRNTSYTTGQARRIIISTAAPSGGGNGDVWIKYTA